MKCEVCGKKVPSPFRKAHKGFHGRGNLTVRRKNKRGKQ